MLENFSLMRMLKMCDVLLLSFRHRFVFVVYVQYYYITYFIRCLYLTKSSQKKVESISFFGKNLEKICKHSKR